ncbi:MAG TPA: sensor histidine kinase [Mycobacteriales bacterium]|nr:sensor histidine kinase [Mycobacteriales bacterium]
MSQPWQIQPTPLSPKIGDAFPVNLARVARFGAAAIIAIQSFTGLPDLSGTQQGLVAGLTVVVIALWTGVVTRRCGDWIDIAALVALIGISAWLGVVTDNGQIYVAGYAALFVAPFWYEMPGALVPWGSAVVAITVGTAFMGQFDLLGGVGNGFGAGFFGLAAYFWGRIMRASEHNANLVRELQESRDAEQRNAVIAERARLARELHDVLAHTLSSLALHLESTRVLGRSRGVDQDVLDRIDRGVALARTGLEEARNAVGTLRDGALPGSQAIESMVADFERVTGITTRFAQTGTPVSLPPEAQVALFRSAQEALTNVGKHAAASQVDVQLAWTAGQVTLRVADNGRGSANGSTLPGGGNGLRGMRERAALAGGRLAAGPADQGFAVELWLPAPEPALSERG